MSRPLIRWLVIFTLVVVVLILIPVHPTWAGNDQQTLPTPTFTPSATENVTSTATRRPGGSNPTAVPASSTPIVLQATVLPSTPGVGTLPVPSSTIQPSSTTSGAVTSSPSTPAVTDTAAVSATSAAPIIGAQSGTRGGEVTSQTSATSQPSNGAPGILDWFWTIGLLVLVVLIYGFFRLRSVIKK